MMAAELEQTSQVVFGEQGLPPVVREEMFPYRYMLSLRLEGCCSIGAISTIMRRFSIELGVGGQDQSDPA